MRGHRTGWFGTRRRKPAATEEAPHSTTPPKRNVATSALYFVDDIVAFSRVGGTIPSPEAIREAWNSLNRTNQRKVRRHLGAALVLLAPHAIDEDDGDG